MINEIKDQLLTEIKELECINVKSFDEIVKIDKLKEQIRLIDAGISNQIVFDGTRDDKYSFSDTKKSKEIKCYIMIKIYRKQS